MKTENPESTFGPRLITLSDGRSGLRSAVTIECREPSADSSPSSPDTRHPSPCCLDFVASDESLDRYDEIISVAGWKLDSYQKNPVFQNAHKYGDIIFTLGKALVTEIRGSARTIPSPGGEGQGEGGTVRASSGGACLFQRIEFAVDVNPMAKIAYGLYKGKFLNAVSVGFVPLAWENGDGTSSRSAGSPSPGGPQNAERSSLVGQQTGGGLGKPLGRGEGGTSEHSSLDTRHASPQQFRRKYTSQELLEVSAVGIPANPNALALGLKSGAVEKSDLRETAELIRHALDHSQPGPDLTHLKFLQQLHSILRS
jgi:hypothetical protein